MKKYCIINKDANEIICVKARGWKAYSRDNVIPTKNYYKTKNEQSATEVVLKLTRLPAEILCYSLNKDLYGGWIIEERD